MVSQVYLLPLFLSCLIVGCGATEYWVRPDSTSHCNTRQPCLTLSEYVQNTSHYFTSNSVLHFLSGNHTISQTTRVIVQHVQNISLVGSAGRATVQCNGRLSFTFWKVDDLQISSIEFIRCGLEITDYYWYVHMFGYQVKVQVALLFVECSSVVLENVTVMESYGYGLLGYNMMMAELNHCLFHHNHWRPQVHSIRYSSIQNNSLSECKAGGNALFSYSPTFMLTSTTWSLNILHSEFAHGRNHYESSDARSKLVHGGGLGIHITIGYSKAQGFNITVYNCSMYKNTASVGANMFLYIHLPLLASTTVHITNCKFIGGKSTSKGGGFMVQINSRHAILSHSLTVYLANLELYGNSATNGSGLYVGVKNVTGFPTLEEGFLCVDIVFIIQQCVCRDNIGKHGSGMYIFSALPVKHFRISIYNLTFSGNIASLAGGAIYVTLLSQWSRVARLPENELSLFETEPVTVLCVIDIITCTFSQTSSPIAVYIRAKVSHPKYLHITIGSTTFHRNIWPADASRRKYNCFVLYLSYIKNITIVNSTFSDNNCTSIAAKSSIFHLQGMVGFYRNTGYSGGALAFHCDTDCESKQSSIMENSMILNPHTSAYIVNNTAVQYGGGILAECAVEHYCFFQTGNLNYTQMDARVVMEGNRAGKAGDSIFGGCLNSCSLKALSLEMILTPKIFSSLFQIHGQTQSKVAASPQKICFCDRDEFERSIGYNYHCKSEASIAHFRGETFHVLAMSVGDYGYASPALVRTVIAPGYSGELEEQQSIQELGNMCANLTYSVRTLQTSIKLHLSVESQMGDDMPLTILNISFRPCPVGFNLSDTPPKCDCALQLRKPGVKCNINTQLIHRPALVWIGNYSDEVVIHTNCPFDYCKSTDNEISLYEQNQQCAFNRSGVLCGACQPGLSLALGTSRCMQCSNVYILLFIPFALAGVALIILMLKCNLTVSTGTLNGLIFYANIIRANHAVFFPLGRSEGFNSFLSVFIAWLNLDLGVEVCLFRGMDAYIRTWLQFVFPLYIWVLVGFMICLSRYSTTIARLSGSNTVSMLATLFLLSYAKLLRTIIASISFTTLTDRHGNTSAVWLLDGNMPAMKGSHIPLVVMSIVALVVYVLPFTMLVLLGPCLQSRSNHRLLQWVTKIKPLLDAYQGPYRDKFRYWTGLLLVVRIVLFAIFGGNALGDPRINLFAITIVVATLLVFWVIAGKVYKKLWMKPLESFFMLNLIILTTSTLFLKSLEGFSVVKKQAVLTSIMVGSTALVFIGILAYQCCQEVTKKSVFKHVLLKCSAFVTNADHDRVCAENSEGVSDGSTAAVPQQPTVSVIAMNELREPLLTDS